MNIIMFNSGIVQPKDKNIFVKDILEHKEFNDGSKIFNKQSVGAMRGRYLVNGVRQDGKQKTSGLTQQYAEFRYDGKTNTLTTVAKDNIVVQCTLPSRIPVKGIPHRFLTPIESERLQNLEDNYTYGVSNSHRIHAIGNSWTVDVIKEIFLQMNLCK